MPYICDWFFCFRCNDDSSLCRARNTCSFYGSDNQTFDRFLSKFSVVDHKTKKKIFITNEKKKVEIGSFLNEEEIDELISLLKKKVRDLNFS